MEKIYTSKTQIALWNEEVQAERLYNALIETYDPYMDYDNECPFCGGTDECVCEVDEGDEDRGFEEGLFGWE